MTLEEIKAVIDAAAAMRVPRFTTDDRQQIKIRRLEDYMLSCAYMRGDLEEAHRWIARTIDRLEDQWLDITAEGEFRLAREREAARRDVAPEVYTALHEAKQIKEDIERQVRRLDKDESTTSRAYTFVTGNN